MGDEHPDWLPEGWEVCVKVRSYGRKDKYYINKSNGLKFNSKPEVLRYLKISGKSKERNKIDITRTAAENLPPGWVKEIRAKKKGRKIRKDPVYIDPVSGCHFRSVPEVLRYLQTKDSGKVESKPEDKDHKSVENHSQSSSSEPKRQSSIIKKADRKATKKNKSDDNQMEQREGDDSLPVKLSDEPQPGSSGEQHPDRMTDNTEVTTRRLRSGTKVAVLRKVKVPEANRVQNCDCNYDSTAADPPKKLPKLNKKEQEGGENQNTRLSDSKQENNVTGTESLKSGSKGAAVENTVVPKVSDSEQREEGNNAVSESQQHKNVKSLKKRKKLTSESPRRTSRRLVRAEVEPSLGLSNEAEVSSPKDSSQFKLSGDPEIKTAGESRKCSESNENPPESRTENPTSSKPKEPATVVPEDISRVEEHKGVEVKEEEKHDKQLDSSLEDLLMDPCIEFAIKTLTGAIPFEDVSRIGDGPVSSLTAANQPSSSSPVLSSDDIWADPCFEFAVKTLTGEMPVENKGSNLQLPLSPPEASGSKSLSLPTFGLENLQPLASFGHFGAETKDYKRQQNVKDLPLPHSLKGNAQNFVDSNPSQRY